MEKNTKKELKVVLSPELYDELRFVFRPEVLENLIYKPEILTETKWQCSCGAENEIEVCPICGMEKNTILSKVNTNFLARHRKERIARKKRAIQDQQAMLAAQMLKKNKKQNQKKEKNAKIGVFIGIGILCIAIVISFFILFGDKDDSDNKPIDTTNNVVETLSPETTIPETEETADAPETTEEPETTDVPETLPPETLPPETLPPETTAPVVPVEVPVGPAGGKISTVGDGKWPTGASGNVSAGGLCYSDGQYDYIAQNGITVLDKAGAVVSILTPNKTLGISGSGTYIFYIDEAYSIHRIDITTKEDITFGLKAKSICTYFDELYYIPNEGTGLYACNFYGDITKIAVKNLNVYALNNTADKLYFSTDESLAVINTQEGTVSTFCPDGAKATSIIEITECIFYTGTDGKLKFYNPAISATFGVEYPRYNVAITYVSAFENRVYIRTLDPNNGAIQWFFTRWTPGTRLFAPTAFQYTGITTNSLYVTASAVYDGNLNRFAVS